MIKVPQIKNLPQGFHYITAITKPQINLLIDQGVIQMGLFDEDVFEGEDHGIRYILRRNPVRVEEINESRISKRTSVEKLLKEKNLYLREHARAKEQTAIKDVTKKIVQLMSTLCSMEMKVKNQASCLKIPRPREKSRQLLKALDIRVPIVLPHRKVYVVTRKKLMQRRKLS